MGPRVAYSGWGDVLGFTPWFPFGWPAIGFAKRTSLVSALSPASSHVYVTGHAALACNGSNRGTTCSESRLHWPPSSL